MIVWTYFVYEITNDLTRGFSDRLELQLQPDSFRWPPSNQDRRPGLVHGASNTPVLSRGGTKRPEVVLVAENLESTGKEEKGPNLA